MSNKRIINLALTGMVPNKELTPYVPVSPEEIVQTAVACSKLGVSVVHIHPRDEQGKPTWRKEVFAQIIAGIREKAPKLLISATTSGRLWNDFERRSECLDLEGDLRPDLASLTVGSMNFIANESVNSPSMIEKLATKMKDRGIKPEIEVFEPGMLYKAKYLIKQGIITGTPYINILLGSLGTSPLEPSTFAAFHALLPPEAIWSVAGIGQFQLQANVIGLVFGGGIRIGLEDNIYYNRETKQLSTNEALVERIVSVMQTMSLAPATPEEAREILGLK